jgi:short subunit dehydrogenase-like uncharacterized protein
VNAGVSGGTVESGMVMFKELSDPSVRRVMGHPYSLTPQFKDEAALKELKDKPSPMRPMWSPAAKSWTGPFIMAAHNEKIVRMSNALLGWKYGTCCSSEVRTSLTIPCRCVVLLPGLCVSRLNLQ